MKFGLIVLFGVMMLLFAQGAGAQWKRMSLPRFTVPGSYGCVQFQNGWLWVGRHELFSSPDTGRTWVSSNLTLEPGDVIHDIRFFDHLNGFVSTSNTGIYVTSDAGTTWKKTFSIPSCWNIAYGPNSSILYTLCTINCNFYISKNSGATWNSINLGGQYGLCLTVAKSGKIYAFVTHDYNGATQGWIMSSTDQGSTWLKHTGLIDGDCFVLAVDSCDSNKLYLMNEDYYSTLDNESNVYLTTDEGNSWKAFTHDAYPAANGGAALTTGTIYIPTDRGTTLRSTDKGVTWKSLTSPFHAPDSRTIACINDNIVVMLDKIGDTWITTNGMGDSLTDDNIISDITLATRDMKVDTLGQEIAIPIIVKGVSHPSDVRLAIHFDPNLEYLGSFSQTNTALDIASERTNTRSTILTRQALSDTLGFAKFLVFADSAKNPVVQFDSVEQIGKILSCGTLQTRPAISTIIVPPGCGIPEISRYLHHRQIPKFSLFPNPTSSEMSIRTTEDIGDATIRIINSIGNIISEDHTNLKANSDHTFNTSALAGGVYVVQISNGSFDTHLRFIVQR